MARAIAMTDAASGFDKVILRRSDVLIGGRTDAARRPRYWVNLRIARTASPMRRASASRNFWNSGESR